MSADSNTPRCQYCDHSRDTEYLCDPKGPDVCQSCKRLIEIEGQVKSIRLMLIGLKTERQRLKMEANQHHERLICRFPPEIAVEVFQQCLPDNPYAPLVISSVCKRWRNIAFSAPQLWQTLFLCFRVLPLPESPSRSVLVKEWIDRAGTLPLSISLFVDKQHNRRADVIQVIRTLEQYRARWLKLHCTGPVWVFSCFSTQSQNFPQLHTLRLDNTSALSVAPLVLHPQRINIFSCSSISLETFVGGMHLTVLTIEGLTPSRLIEILHSAPKLKKCTVSDPIDDRQSHQLLSPFVHRDLEILEITAWFSETVFQQIQCPSLKSLTLDTDDYQPVMHPNDIPRFVEFLQKSRCSLEHLCLEDAMGLAGIDIALVCENIPTLKHLNIVSEEPSLSEMLASSLEDKLSQFIGNDYKMEPRYLPALASLSLVSIDNTQAHYLWWIIPSIFGYYLNPESHPGYHRRTLTEVTLTPYREMTDDVDFIATVTFLREAGVRLNLE